MNTESPMAVLGGKLAIAFIPKAVAGSGIPEPITRAVLEILIGALQEQQNALDLKLRKLLGSYYQNGVQYLSAAKNVDGEQRKYWINQALDKFMTASSVEEDALLAAKSRFFVGVCFDLLEVSTSAREWYEQAYTAAYQQLAQWQNKREHFVEIHGEWRARQQQFVELQQFTNALSQVLVAHGSTLIRKPSPHLSSRTSTLHLIRQPALLASLKAFDIMLDHRQVGTIRNGKDFTLEIQSGIHLLFLRIDPYTGGGSSEHLTFDIAPGEKMTFLCNGSMKLWKQ